MQVAISSDVVWKVVTALAVTMVGSILAAIKLSRKLNFKDDWLQEFNDPNTQAIINRSRAEWIASDSCAPLLRATMDKVYEKRIAMTDQAIQNSENSARAAQLEAEKTGVLAKANIDRITTISDEVRGMTSIMRDFPGVISVMLKDALEPVIDRQAEATKAMADSIRTLDSRQRDDGRALSALQAMINTPTYHGENRRHGERQDDSHTVPSDYRRREGDAI